MDVRLHSNSQLHYGVNGGPGQNSRTGGENSAPPFLSQDVQECLQFFEDTIESLEEGLEEEGKQRPARVAPLEISRYPVAEVDGRSALSPGPGSATGSSFLPRTPSPNDQDIIDLVRPEPDLVQTKGPIFSPTSPDFQHMVPYPESHFEIKPKHDPLDSLPSEYNPPLPSGYGATDSSYHPAGCIPTPVLIAQKIAENQAGSTSTSSQLRRASLEADKPLSYGADHAVKQGPPTSAKPTRFPSNISLVRGSKEPPNQSLANVSINERRAQMLANLSGTTNPLLLQETPSEEPKSRNVPTRSISFRDPTPDVSRREALSKLGLTRNRNMSGDALQPAPPKSTSLDRFKGRDASVSPKTERCTKLTPEVHVTPPPSHVVRKPQSPHMDRNLQPSPTAVTQSSYYPPPPDNKVPSSPPPEVTALEFNNYGGKSIVVHPSSLTKSEPPTSPTRPGSKSLPPVLSNPSEFNTYGGKTKVMTPHPAATTQSALPDILSSHIDKSQTLPAKTEPLPHEHISSGVKSLTINPITGLRSVRPRASAPAPAPRPPRHSYHGATSSQMAASRPLSPERKRRSNSMFRPQGITVQFSGRGATSESRRDALRKLGLLKES